MPLASSSSPQRMERVAPWSRSRLAKRASRRRAVRVCRLSPVSRVSSRRREKLFSGEKYFSVKNREYTASATSQSPQDSSAEMV